MTHFTSTHRLALIAALWASGAWAQSGPAGGEITETLNPEVCSERSLPSPAAILREKEARYTHIALFCSDHENGAYWNWDWSTSAEAAEQSGLEHCEERARADEEGHGPVVEPCQLYGTGQRPAPAAAAPMADVAFVAPEDGLDPHESYPPFRLLAYSISDEVRGEDGNAPDHYVVQAGEEAGIVSLGGAVATIFGSGDGAGALMFEVEGVPNFLVADENGARLSQSLDEEAWFWIRPPLEPEAEGFVSFESQAFPGQFLRHSGFRLTLDPISADSASLHRRDATFKPAKVLGCAEALQGRIAWDYEGNTGWSEGNIAELCQSAPNDEPAFCFDRVMHGGLDRGGGTFWPWTDAVALCRGAVDATGRISCFQQRVQAGANWSEAISACASTGEPGQIASAEPSVGAPAAEDSAGEFASAEAAEQTPAPALAEQTPMVSAEDVVVASDTETTETIDANIVEILTGFACPASDIPNPGDMLRSRPEISHVALFCALHSNGWSWSGSFGITAEDARTRGLAQCEAAARTNEVERGPVIVACQLYGAAERIVDAGLAFDGGGSVRRQEPAPEVEPLIERAEVPEELALDFGPEGPVLSASCLAGETVPLLGVENADGMLRFTGGPSTFQQSCVRVELTETEEDVILSATCMTEAGDFNETTISLLGASALVQLADHPQCAPPAEPNTFTADGLGYDFKGLDDFIVFQSEDGAVVVQARREPWVEDPFEIAHVAVATQVGDDRVDIYATPDLRIYVDGEPVDPSFDTRPLDGGGSLARDGDRFYVRWPDEEIELIVEVEEGSQLTFALDAPGVPFEGGLGGIPDGDPGNDLRSRTGESFDPSAGPEAMARFAESWRVSIEESLFTEPLRGVPLLTGLKEVPETAEEGMTEPAALPEDLALGFGPTGPVLEASCLSGDAVPLAGIANEDGTLRLADGPSTFQNSCVNAQLGEQAGDLVLSATCMTEAGGFSETSISLLGTATLDDLIARPGCAPEGEAAPAAVAEGSPQTAGPQPNQPAVASPQAPPRAPSIEPGHETAGMPLQGAATVFSADGLASDIPASGDFVFTRSTDGSIAIHARREPWSSDLSSSVVTALFMQVGEDTVELYAVPELTAYVNGAPIEIADEALPLDGGGLLSRGGREFRVDWPESPFMVRAWIHEGSHISTGIRPDPSLSYEGLVRFTEPWLIPAADSPFSEPAPGTPPCACEVLDGGSALIAR